MSDLSMSLSQRDETEEILTSFMNSPIGIYIVTDNRFSFTNPRFQQITGMSQEELSGMSPSELVVPEDRERVRKNAIGMLKGISNDPYQYRVKNKHGDMLWIMESVASIHSDGKRATLGYFMDITENEGFTGAFMSSPIGIYIIQDGRFRFTNPKFQEITGYSQQELELIPPIELVFSEDRESVREHAREMLKGQKAANSDGLPKPLFRSAIKGKERFWAISWISPLSATSDTLWMILKKNIALCSTWHGKALF